MLRLLFILSLVVTTLHASAQKRKVKNLEGFDNRIMHFGFALAFNNADFYMDADIGLTDSLKGLETETQSGFNIGIVSDLHMGPLFNLRFIPTLSFAQRNLEYKFADGFTNKGLKKTRTIVKPVESTFIDIPLYLKFRSVRNNNFAAYIIGGAKYSLDLASHAKTDNNRVQDSEIVVKLKKDSFLWEVGVGTDFFLEYFKFGIELKMSYGLTNLIINDYTRYSDPIKTLNSKIFTVSFLFEG